MKQPTFSLRAKDALRKAAAWCAGGVAFYVLADTLFTGLAAEMMQLLPGSELFAWTLDVLAGAASLGLAAVLLGKVCGVPPRRMGLKKPLRPVLRLALPLYLVASQLWNLLAAVVGHTTGSMQSISLPGSPAARIPAFLAVCVVPAVGEEVFFRGALQGVLRPHGARLAICGQALLFALLHRRLSAVVFALPAGLFFGYLAEVTQSLWPGMTLHFVNNALAFFCFSAGETLAAKITLFELFVFPLWAAAAWGVTRLRGKRLFLRLPQETPVTALLHCPGYVAAAVLGVAMIAADLLQGAGV